MRQNPVNAPNVKPNAMMAPNTVISTTMRNLTVMPFHTARSVAAQNVFIIARELGVQMHKSQIMPTT